MDPPQLARDLHDLWERARVIQSDARGTLERIPRAQAWCRLALELALRDLLNLAGRAAALAELAETCSHKKGK